MVLLTVKCDACDKLIHKTGIEAVTYLDECLIVASAKNGGLVVAVYCDDCTETYEFQAMLEDEVE